MFKKLFAATVLTAAISAPAHALVLVNDWTLNAGPSTYTSINSISFFQSVAAANTITQDAPAPYVGQTFSETGTMTSFGYGSPDAAFTPFVYATVNLNGAVTSVGAGGVDYNLTGGSGVVTSGFGGLTLFNLALVSGAGDLGSTVLDIGNSGSTLALFNIVNDASSQAAFAGQADLLYALGLNGLFLRVDTNNDVVSAPVCTANGCTFKVTSDGSAELYRIPEPQSAALFGIALLGLVAARRKALKA